MIRLPIRLRVTLAFAAAMTLVLGAVGTFLYVKVGVALEEQLDESLEVQADGLELLWRESPRRPPFGLGTEDETVSQIYRPGELPPGALISPEEAQRSVDGALFLRRDRVGVLGGEPARLLVRPVSLDRESFLLVVGASLEDREEALEELLTQLLVAGPLALLLATGVGYLLAGAALGPVEAMRRRAEEVSSERTGQRLPLPAARDEVRRLGETLNAMLARLEAGIARERRFVGDASHELRTPLALLRTELELALRKPRPVDELEQALASALDEVDRVVRLAEDLLVLARADDGRLPLRRAPIAASDLLQTVARRFAARAAAEGRAIEVGESANGSVAGDQLRLEQALGNLVDNALRHGTGTVRLEAQLTDGELELSVTDEGGGFPAIFLPRAFERFARADEARGGGSTGLGLSIVQAIARAHDGTAQAENRASGSGAVVSMTLPASRA